jgi:chromosome segregation protein
VRRLEVRLSRAEEERDRAIAAAVGADNRPVDSRPEVALALWEGRAAAAEAEVERLLLALDGERENAARMRRELAARVLQTATLRRRRVGPSAKALLQQVTETKREAKAEANRLRAAIKRLQSKVRGRC